MWNKIIENESAIEYFNQEAERLIPLLKAYKGNFKGRTAPQYLLKKKSRQGLMNKMSIIHMFGRLITREMKYPAIFL